MLRNLYYRLPFTVYAQVLCKMKIADYMECKSNLLYYLLFTKSTLAEVMWWNYKFMYIWMFLLKVGNSILFECF
jgi:hypothetical protein